MRTRSAALVLLAGLAACTPLRRPLTPEPAPPQIATRSVPVPGPAHCLDHPRIDVWEHRLRSQPDLREETASSLARGARYLPRLREIMAANGVPESLALLPVIESGFWPEARGRSGERGLWQLRRQTARRFGLLVDARRDERVLPERSTEAAARYLRYLHVRYGEWPLALAAYNAGETRVDRALARQPDATFWQLAERGWLPRTSTDFVPRFIAVVRLSERAAFCG